jgi:hypothetical protein
MKSVRELFNQSIETRIFACKGGGRIVTEPVGPFLAAHYVPKSADGNGATFIGEPHSVWLNPKDPRFAEARDFVAQNHRPVVRARERGIRVG